MDFLKFLASLSVPPFLSLRKGAGLLSSPCRALAWSPEGCGSGPLSRSLSMPGMKSEQCAVRGLPWSQRQLPPPAHTCTHALTRSRGTRGEEGLEVFHDMHLWRWTAPGHWLRWRQWRQAVRENEQARGPGEVRGRRERRQDVINR